MRLAWIENGKVRDICCGDPFERYHPEVAVFYDTEVSEEAENGDGWADGVIVKPDPVEPSKPAPRTWGSSDVRAGLSMSERVKWDNDASDTIKTAKIEFATPQELAATTEVLQMLVAANDISQDAMDRILGVETPA